MTNIKILSAITISAILALGTLTLVSFKQADAISPTLQALQAAVASLQADVATLQNTVLSLQNQINNIQLIPGPAGPQGATGPAGPVGTFYAVKRDNPIPIGFDVAAYALCNTGDIATGGGYNLDVPEGNTRVHISQPLVTPFDTSPPSGWVVGASIPSTASAPSGVTVIVVCEHFG